MNEKPWKKICLIVLSVLLGITFIGSGGMKLAGHEMAVENFKRWGLPTWFLYGTGCLEVLAGLGMFFRKTRFPSAGLLIVVMIGAAATHIKAGETGELAPPIILGVMASLAAWLGCPCAKSAVSSQPPGEKL